MDGQTTSGLLHVKHETNACHAIEDQYKSDKVENAVSNQTPQTYKEQVTTALDTLQAQARETALVEPASPIVGQNKQKRKYKLYKSQLNSIAKVSQIREAITAMNQFNKRLVNQNGYDKGLSKSLNSKDYKQIFGALDNLEKSHKNFQTSKLCQQANKNPHSTLVRHNFFVDSYMKDQLSHSAVMKSIHRPRVKSASKADRRTQIHSRELFSRDESSLMKLEYFGGKGQLQASPADSSSHQHIKRFSTYEGQVFYKTEQSGEKVNQDAMRKSKNKKVKPSKDDQSGKGSSIKVWNTKLPVQSIYGELKPLIDMSKEIIQPLQQRPKTRSTEYQRPILGPQSHAKVDLSSFIQVHPQTTSSNQASQNKAHREAPQRYPISSKGNQASSNNGDYNSTNQQIAFVRPWSTQQSRTYKPLNRSQQVNKILHMSTSSITQNTLSVVKSQIKRQKWTSANLPQNQQKQHNNDSVQLNESKIATQKQLKLIGNLQKSRENRLKNKTDHK